MPKKKKKNCPKRESALAADFRKDFWLLYIYIYKKKKFKNEVGKSRCRLLMKSATTCETVHMNSFASEHCSYEQWWSRRTIRRLHCIPKFCLTKLGSGCRLQVKRSRQPVCRVQLNWTRQTLPSSLFVFSDVTHCCFFFSGKPNQHFWPLEGELDRRRRLGSRWRTVGRSFDRWRRCL